MEKILWIDTETTGLSPVIHSMIQIAGIIDIDGKEVERFNFRSQPHSDFEIDDYALRVNKSTRDEIFSYPPMVETHNNLIKTFEKYINKYDKTDKFIVAGQNIKFDMDILSHFFMRLNDTYLGSWIDFKNRIDLYDITNALKVMKFIEVETVSLEPLCKYFGITYNAHDAMDDIAATREIYYIAKKNLSWKWKK